jgi:hypothetical protein
MADGAITLTSDEALSEKLERRAAAAGMSQQEFAQQALERSLFDYDDYVWIGDDPRKELAEEPEEVDLSDCKPWDEVKRDLMARLEARLAAKA